MSAGALTTLFTYVVKAGIHPRTIMVSRPFNVNREVSFLVFTMRILVCINTLFMLINVSQLSNWINDYIAQ